jgi:hypothetical protein
MEHALDLPRVKVAELRAIVVGSREVPRQMADAALEELVRPAALL